MPPVNFSAGPAMLPRAVMEQARDEFLDWQGRGVSVLEISHRSAAFMEIAAQSAQDLAALLALPDNYKILFLQGGASHLMSMVPLNLCRKTDTADYLLTGAWSRRAVGEARRLVQVNVAADAEDGGFTGIPPRSDWRLSEAPAYCYFCDNETIAGVEFPAAPELPADTVLVSDMTSNFLTRPFPVEKYGVVFAGAQKNFGPAGLTVAIVREDLLGRARADTPFLYDFGRQAEHDSMFNTPPTFAWYMAGLAFAWIREQGGLEEMNRRALARSSAVYDFIDASDFYHNLVDPACRSRVNAPFQLADSSLDAAFLAAAEERGMLGLRGHRSVGGMRASMYNGMPMTGVETLVEFMADFASRHG